MKRIQMMMSKIYFNKIFLSEMFLYFVKFFFISGICLILEFINWMENISEEITIPGINWNLGY